MHTMTKTYLSQQIASLKRDVQYSRDRLAQMQERIAEQERIIADLVALLAEDAKEGQKGAALQREYEQMPEHARAAFGSLAGFVAMRSKLDEPNEGTAHPLPAHVWLEYSEATPSQILSALGIDVANNRYAIAPEDLTPEQRAAHGVEP